MVKSAPISREKDVKTAAKKPPAPAAQQATPKQDSFLLQHLQRGLLPANLRPADILQLQRTVGNRAVGAWLRGSAQVRPVIQAKLTIGQPDDKYEQEADRIAAQVVAQINAPNSGKPLQEQAEQRQALSGKNLQTKPVLQLSEAFQGGEASTHLESAINRSKGGGQPLDSHLQQSMGQAMGADFSGVRVHTDAQADQFNQSIQAKAFTVGQDVFFREGTYEPGSREGQALLAHELTHVVQQTMGNTLLVQRMSYVLPFKINNNKNYTEETDRTQVREDAERAGHLPILDTPNQVKAIAQEANNPDVRELHIFAHGNQERVGTTMPVEDLHAHLRDDCKVNNPIRLTRAIILHSCLSGEKPGTLTSKSPAEKLFDLEWKEGDKDISNKKVKGQVVVVGYRSLVFTDFNGQSRCLYPVFWSDALNYEKKYKEVRNAQPTDEKIRQVEDLYLLSASDSRIVLEKRKGLVNQSTINEGVNKRAEQQRPYSFDELNKGANNVFQDVDAQRRKTALDKGKITL